MRFQYSFRAFLVVALFVFAGSVVFAQKPKSNEKKINSTIVYSEDDPEKLPVAEGANLYCAGYIQSGPVGATIEVVGAEEEKDYHVYGEGDVLYVNGGAASGMKKGDVYSVIRPRGKVNSDWTEKKDLGIWIQEVGAVEVMVSKSDHAIVRVKNSCGEILFGDLLKPFTKRESPLFKKRGPIDLYADPSGKAMGRIVMGREGQEMFGREMIAYVDLGREDNVKIGDYLTIFRPLGTGNIYTKVPKESVDNRDDGNESDRYEGGHFSIQSPRKKGDNAGGATVTSEDAKSRRPNGLRRVVGEMVVLNVMERTATVMVVRAATEIHTGDWVEIQ
ncbi:MAG: hypothetical protein R2684_13670 [Pyrinomonadaceae bacterium]